MSDSVNSSNQVDLPTHANGSELSELQNHPLTSTVNEEEKSAIDREGGDDRGSRWTSHGGRGAGGEGKAADPEDDDGSSSYIYNSCDDSIEDMQSAADSDGNTVASNPLLDDENDDASPAPIGAPSQQRQVRRRVETTPTWKYVAHLNNIGAIIINGHDDERVADALNFLRRSVWAIMTLVREEDEAHSSSSSSSYSSSPPSATPPIAPSGIQQRSSSVSSESAGSVVSPAVQPTTHHHSAPTEAAPSSSSASVSTFPVVVDDERKLEQLFHGLVSEHSVRMKEERTKSLAEFAFRPTIRRRRRRRYEGVRSPDEEAMELDNQQRPECDPDLRYSCYHKDVSRRSSRTFLGMFPKQVYPDVAEKRNLSFSIAIQIQTTHSHYHQQEVAGTYAPAAATLNRTTSTGETSVEDHMEPPSSSILPSPEQSPSSKRRNSGNGIGDDTSSSAVPQSSVSPPRRRRRTGAEGSPSRDFTTSPTRDFSGASFATPDYCLGRKRNRNCFSLLGQEGLDSSCRGKRLSTVALYNMALAHHRMGNYDESLSLLQMAHKIALAAEAEYSRLDPSGDHATSRQEEGDDILPSHSRSGPAIDRKRGALLLHAARVMCNIGQIYAAPPANQHGEARQCYEAALGHASASLHRFRLACGEHNLAQHELNHEQEAFMAERSSSSSSQPSRRYVQVSQSPEGVQSARCIALCLTNLAKQSYLEGRHDMAMLRCRKAMTFLHPYVTEDMAEQSNDSCPTESSFYGRIALELDASIILYNTALAQLRIGGLDSMELGQVYNFVGQNLFNFPPVVVARFLRHIGSLIHHVQGDVVDGFVHLRYSLNILNALRVRQEQDSGFLTAGEGVGGMEEDSFGVHWEMASTLSDIGAILRDREQYDEAVSVFQECVSLIRHRASDDMSASAAAIASHTDHTDPSLSESNNEDDATTLVALAFALHNAGVTHQATGRLDDAMHAQVQALEFLRSVDVPDERSNACTAAALNEIGNIHLERGRLADAMAQYAESSRIYISMGLRPHSMLNIPRGDMCVRRAGQARSAATA